MLPSRSRQSLELSTISRSQTVLDKNDMEDYKVKIWKEYRILLADEKLVFHLFLSDLAVTDFNPLNHTLLFTRTSKRSTDTQVMDLIPLNFKSFKHTIGRRHNPNCDIDHNQLMECPKLTYREPLGKLCRTPDCEIGIFLSVILEADREHVQCFRSMAQILNQTE